jgi:phosphoglycolate phosphatase
VARWAYRPGRQGDARCGCERWPDRNVRGSSGAAVRTLRQQPPISPWKPGSGRESLEHRCLLPQDAGMAIQELVWDMDGTLLDTTVVVPAAFVRAVRKLGGRSVSPDRVVAAYSRGTPEVILAHLVGRDLTVEEAEVYYTELQDVEVAPYPGVVDVMRALREQGRVAAVFTGASSRAAAMLLKAAGLDTDVLVGGDHVPNPKPAADGLLLAAAQVGVEATALAYIGDSPLDLRTAAAAGSHRAAASWGHMYDGSEPADSILARPEQALDLFELSLE